MLRSREPFKHDKELKISSISSKKSLKLKSYLFHRLMVRNREQRKGVRRKEIERGRGKQKERRKKKSKEEQEFQEWN